jgi:hypothetical protein
MKKIEGRKSRATAPLTIEEKRILLEKHGIATVCTGSKISEFVKAFIL